MPPIQPQPQNQSKRKFFFDSLNLLFAVFLVIVTPFFIQLLNANQITPKIEDFRENNPTVQSRRTQKNYVAKVIEIVDEQEVDTPIINGTSLQQTLKVEFLEGQNEGDVIEVQRSVDVTRSQEKFRVGEKVVLIGSEIQLEDGSVGEEEFALTDKYRVDYILLFFAFFIVLVILVAGIRGVTAFLGLFFSFLVLIQFLVPRILFQENILFTTISAVAFIAISSLFLSHGFSKKILISAASLFVSIGLAAALASLGVWLARLSGLSSDEVLALQTSNVADSLNYRGLLLAGMIIGSIGVLDDVIVAQATAMEEIYLANPKQSRATLFFRGMRIGKEHIISMINSLAFAYVGTSLPFLILLSLYNYNQLWVNINNEIIAEEIIRTLAGSMALLLAIPIATILATIFNYKQNWLNFDKAKKSLKNLKKIDPDVAKIKNLKSQKSTEKILDQDFFEEEIKELEKKVEVENLDKFELKQKEEDQNRKTTTKKLKKTKVQL